MILACPVCKKQHGYACFACHSKCPSLVDVRTGEILSTCMEPSCKQFLIVTSPTATPTVLIRLCHRCKIAAPGLRQVIENKGLRKDFRP